VRHILEVLLMKLLLLCGHGIGMRHERLIRILVRVAQADVLLFGIPSSVTLSIYSSIRPFSAL
jgi:hypothetical protein